MFLFDNTSVHQWTEMETEVRRLCDRIGANLEVCLKFDERKLAYEIKGRKRGTYVLTYFEADPDRITDLERDARLSEILLRTLVLRADHLTEARLAELKEHPAEQPLQPIAGDGRRGDFPRHGRDRADARADSQAGGKDQASPKDGDAQAKPATATAEAPAEPQPAAEAPAAEPAPEPAPDGDLKKEE
jgi:small subunit ribosomal protein S6